jgi:hypothetical protein
LNIQGLDDKKAIEAYDTLNEKYQLTNKELQKALEFETKNKEMLIIHEQMKLDIEKFKTEKDGLDLEIQNLKLKNIEILNNKENFNEEYSNLKLLLGMYIYMYICMYVCIYAYLIFTFMYKCVPNICLLLRISVYIFTYLHTDMQICSYRHIYLVTYITLWILLSQIKR